MHASRPRDIPKNTISIPEYADGKEYIVGIKPNTGAETLWDDLENATDNIPHLPNRAVRVFNEREHNQFLCHYVLTDAEAKDLRLDERVYCVELPPYHRSDFIIETKVTETQNFNKPTVNGINPDWNDVSNGKVNWGLTRVNSATNNYGAGLTTNKNYDYVLDGTGVDVVIHDSGLQIDHPEFTDANGNSRVHAIDWYAASGVTGTMPNNHYMDTLGHGTHVAGIAAGKTFGWAKNAAVYSVKLYGLEGGQGDSNSGLRYPDCFDVIIGWHNRKPVDPNTGFKRPTIVNMSWGTFSHVLWTGNQYGSITGIIYRGVQYNVNTVQLQYGMNPNGYNHRYAPYDLEIENMIAAGIHVCIAAGNSGSKIDTPSGPDYNNAILWYLFGATNYYYYQQGASPHSSNAIKVGSIDASSKDANTEHKVYYSEGGPGVDIYAPGTCIVSSTSNINLLNQDGYASNPYFLNSSYNEANVSGTSMASPQVCGLGALFLQLRPDLSPAQLKQQIINSSKSTLYSTGLDNDYLTTDSLLGGDSRMLYNPYNTGTSVGISGAMTISGSSVNIK